MNGKKITSLVTGGAGFIASHVCDELIKAGHTVVVLDDLSGGTLANVHPESLFVEGSILDQKLVQKLFEEHHFTYVYHLAAYAAEGLSHFIRSFNYHNNLIGSINLINESVKHKIECLVFTSSIAVYGQNQLPMLESTIPEPLDPYGIAKYAVERDLMAAREMFGLNSIIFRPHNVFGDRQNIGDRYRNVAGIFMNQILQGNPITIVGDGEQTRAFTYIADVAPYIANSVNIKEAYNNTFNLGSDQHYTINELARELFNVTGVKKNIKYVEARKEVIHAYSDHSKVNSVFKIDEKLTTSLKDGLQKTFDWVRIQEIPSRSYFKNIEILDNLPEMWLEENAEE